MFCGVDCGGFLLVGCGGFSWFFLVFWVVVFVGFVACLRDVSVIVFCLLGSVVILGVGLVWFWCYFGAAGRLGFR